MFPPRKIIDNTFWGAQCEATPQELKARTNSFLGNQGLSSQRKLYQAKEKNRAPPAHT
jgi:hypothetical protein